MWIITNRDYQELNDSKLEIEALQQRNQELEEKISTLEVASLANNVQDAPSTSSAQRNWRKDTQRIHSDRQTLVNVSTQLQLHM